MMTETEEKKTTIKLFFITHIRQDTGMPVVIPFKRTDKETRKVNEEDFEILHRKLKGAYIPHFIMLSTQESLSNWMALKTKVYMSRDMAMQINRSHAWWHMFNRQKRSVG